MSIDAIGGVSGIGGSGSVWGTNGVNRIPTVADPGDTASNGADFAKMLGDGLQSLQNAQTKADQLAVAAATGSLTDVHDYTIAATQASLATSLTVAVRNKALESFNEIMRMQA